MIQAPISFHTGIIGAFLFYCKYVRKRIGNYIFIQEEGRILTIDQSMVKVFVLWLVILLCKYMLSIQACIRLYFKMYKSENNYINICKKLDRGSQIRMN